MGLMDNLARAGGTKRGGLMALGEMFTEMGASMAMAQPGDQFGTTLARGISAGTPVLSAGLQAGKDDARRAEFEEWAETQAMFAEGPRERQLYKSLSMGPSGDPMTKMLPALWQAQDRDRPKAASGSDIARDKATRAARQRLIENPGLLGKMTLEGENVLLNQARRPLRTGEDPDYNLFHQWASQNTLFGEGGAKGIPWDQYRSEALGMPEVTEGASSASATGASGVGAEGVGFIQGTKNYFSGLLGGLDEGANEPAQYGRPEDELMSLLGQTAEPGQPISLVPPQPKPMMGVGPRSHSVWRTGLPGNPLSNTGKNLDRRLAQLSGKGMPTKQSYGADTTEGLQRLGEYVSPSQDIYSPLGPTSGPNQGNYDSATRMMEEMYRLAITPTRSVFAPNRQTGGR